jgi:hypothetical protein
MNLPITALCMTGILCLSSIADDNPSSRIWHSDASRALPRKILSVEDVLPLEAGFVKKMLEVPTSCSFESVAHYSYLFHGERRLGNISFWSISPSGRYAAFDRYEGTEGYLEIYDAKLHLFRTAEGPFFVPNDFRWSKTEDHLTIIGYSPKTERSENDLARHLPEKLRHGTNQ